jgi:hypothetical protein
MVPFRRDFAAWPRLSGELSDPSSNAQAREPSAFSCQARPMQVVGQIEVTPRGYPRTRPAGSL